MATIRGKGRVQILDFEHESASCSWFFNFDDSQAIADVQNDADTTASAIAGCSNGAEKFREALYYEFVSDVSPGKTGAYPNSEDKAVVFFFDAKGRTVKIEIPSPKDTCFLPGDAETVNTASGPISVLITNYIAAATPTGYKVCSSAGDEIVGAYRGYRVRAKNKVEQPGYFQAIG